MKKYITYKIIVAFGFALFVLSAKAQQVNTLYFFDNVPVRHYMNPAFQPNSDLYINLPVFGYMNVGVVNNSLSVKDLFYNKNNQTISFLHPDGNKNSFYKRLRPTTKISTGLHTTLLGGGFRLGNDYWTISLSEKVEGQGYIPKDLFKLLIKGNPENENNFNFKSFGVDISAYTELAAGYSKKTDDKLTVGGKLKLLLGTANMYTKNDAFNLYAGSDKWNISGSGVLNIASPAEKVLNEDDSFDPEFPSGVGSWLKPKGFGAGIDLGVTYKPIEPLTLSAALLDLGFIRWKGNAKNITYVIDYEFEGLFSEDDDMQTLDMNNILDSLLNGIEENLKYDVGGTKPFTVSTSPKLNIGAEYAFYDNKLSVGLLSSTIFHRNKVFEEITASVMGRPTNWFNASLSYSLLNGRFATIGTGLWLRSGFVNWHLSTDFVPFSYAKATDENDGSSSLIPYKTKGLNMALGVSFAFGNNKKAKAKNE